MLGPGLGGARVVVLGLNGAALWGVDPTRARQRAAADPIGKARAEYLAEASPGFTTYGPRTLTEFERYRRLAGAP